MNGVARRYVRRLLAARPEAPAEAREILAASCRDWAVPQYAEAGALAVSELVTNAVVHAGTAIRLDITLAGDGLTVAVHDEDEGEPVIVPSTGCQVGGRGLAIVESVSTGWGVRAEGTGKTVWCLLGSSSH